MALSTRVIESDDGMPWQISGATYSILKDEFFERSRKTLEGKAIELLIGNMEKLKQKTNAE